VGQPRSLHPLLTALLDGRDRCDGCSGHGAGAARGIKFFTARAGGGMSSTKDLLWLLGTVETGDLLA
jgi:hypothetical protein